MNNKSNQEGINIEDILIRLPPVIIKTVKLPQNKKTAWYCIHHCRINYNSRIRKCLGISNGRKCRHLIKIANPDYQNASQRIY